MAHFACHVYLIVLSIRSFSNSTGSQEISHLWRCHKEIKVYSLCPQVTLWGIQGHISISQRRRVSIYNNRLHILFSLEEKTNIYAIIQGRNISIIFSNKLLFL